MQKYVAKEDLKEIKNQLNQIHNNCNDLLIDYDSISEITH